MRFAYLLMAVLLLTNGASARSIQKQTVSFSVEEDFKNPVQLPRPVLDLLKNSRIVRDCLENEQKPDAPQAWFTASKVQLAGGQPSVYVINGIGPLGGGNVGTFWLVQLRGKKAELLLETVAHSLAIKSTATRRHRNIETLSATAVENTTTEFRFDGKKYVPMKTCTEGNGGEPLRSSD